MQNIVNKITSLVRLIAGPGVARVFSGSVVYQICGLILSLALPYLLCDADFGAIRVVMAYMAVVLMAGGFCLPPATASYIGRSITPEDKARYGAHGLYLGFTISFSIGATVLLLTWRCRLFDSQTVRLALMGRAAVLFLMVLMLINLRSLQALGKIHAVARLTAAVGIVKLLLVILLTKLWGIWGWILGMGASDLVLFLLTMHSVWPHLTFSRPRWKEIQDLLRFASIQVISGIIAMVAGNLDMMALERTANLAAVGHYGLAVMFFKNATLLPTAFGVANFAKIGAVSCSPAELKPLLFKMFIRMFALMLAVAIVLFTLVPVFIRAVYPAPYQASIPILRLLCIGLMFLSTWVLISQVNIAIGKPLFEVLMSSTGLLFMAGSLYVFLWQFKMGLVGAAWSLNICYIFGSIMGSILLLRHLLRMKPSET